MFEKDIDYKKRTLIAAILVAIRLILANSQMMFILPFSAPLDDDLYFNWAVSIVDGNWLGEYNHLTLSKYPFFGIYLAALHKLGIPYLVGNCLMWIICGAFVVLAFSPVVKTNWYRLALFTAFIYSPSTWAEHTLRVYRDSIFPVLCTMFFVALAGWALRLKKDIRHNIGYMLVAGVSLAMAWTTREDGFWLLPFAIVAITTCIIYIIIDKKLKNKLLRIATTAIPAVITAAFILTICSINNKYYGVFTLSDFDDGPFADCFGAMTTLSHRDWHPLVSVPEDVRMRMYEDCPSFAQFYEYLDAPDSRIKQGYSTRDLGDYKSGQLYWAIRRAATELGIYDTAVGAQEFWAQLAEEVEIMRLHDENALPARSSLTPPIRAEYVQPVIEEAVHSIGFVLTWQDMLPFEYELSYIVTGQIDKWEAFLHEQSNYAAQENSDLPYHTPFQSRCYALMNGITWIYRALTIPMLLLALAALVRGFFTFTRHSYEKQILLFVMLGMLLMGVFRVFIIAFMEVAAFDIGTYAMYLGAVYPVVITVAGLGLAAWKTN